MSKEVAYNEYAVKVMQQLPQGAFLTTASGEKVNSMTIGWGTIGIMWSKPVFTVMVRTSRFTHDLLAQSDDFTVSIPLKDMKKELAVCGSKSGRNMDKLALAGIHTQPAKKVKTPVIAGAGLHYECKLIYKQDMESAALADGLLNACYPNQNDYHTIYVGEIVATYLDD